MPLLKKAHPEQDDPQSSVSTLPRKDSISAEVFADLKYTIHQRLISELDHTKIEGGDTAANRAAIEEAVNTLLAAESTPLTWQQRQKLVQEVIDEVLGLGPLEPLLKDPTVSEIMVNAYNEIYIERSGKLYLTDRTFRDDTHIMTIIDKMIAPLGRRIDEASPMVDARLPAGYRVNAIIPPLAVRGPTITIRKFFEDRFDMEDLIRIGTFTVEVAEFLQACIKMRLNIIISGGTGTGKTTLLNALSQYIPDGERIITIEDPAELKLRLRHVVSLETRPPGLEGKGQVTQRDLVRNALRMRPDRIIVGEVRSGEAFDMLQAMNTGHEGSVCTVHANTPRDAVSRIENMVLMAGPELPIRAVREQLASAIHLIVHVSRLRDGTRRVTQVTEVAGMEGDTVTIQDIFIFHQQGVDENGRIVGVMRPTGIRPRFTERFREAGIFLKPDIFICRND